MLYNKHIKELKNHMHLSLSKQVNCSIAQLSSLVPSLWLENNSATDYVVQEYINRVLEE